MRSSLRLTLVVLTAIILLLPATQSLSYTIISDPNVFYSMYENPDTVIDFTTLKDGIAFDNVPNLRPISTYTDLILWEVGPASDPSYTVREEAFSDDWLFRQVLGVGSFDAEVGWRDGNIFTSAMSIYSTNPQPFALQSSVGFMGIIPDNAQDHHYVIGDITLYQLEAGFSEVPQAPVPEPTTLLLSGLGLLCMGAYIRKRRTS